MKKRFVAVLICMLTLFLFVGSAKASENLTIYVDDGNADYLAELVVSGEKNADSLIALLAQYGMIPEGTVVNSFEILDQEDVIVGKIDLSKEYEEALSHTGTAGETMYIYCVVNTLIKNLGIDKVRLTSDGEVISTGHAIYEDDLAFYDHIIEASEWNGNTVNAQSTNVDGLGQSNVTVIDESSEKPESSLYESMLESSEGAQGNEDTNIDIGTDSDEEQTVSAIKKDVEGTKLIQLRRIFIGTVFVVVIMSLVLCIFIRVGKRRKI